MAVLRSNCFDTRIAGRRTVREIGQLIERAITGEFDEAQVEESALRAELLNLIED
jgi:hypothetical protein